jgi:hypothetical protein
MSEKHRLHEETRRCYNPFPDLWINDAGACYQYLMSLTGVQCEVFGIQNIIVFVGTGSAAVAGVNQGPNFLASSLWSVFPHIKFQRAVEN